MQNGVKWPEQRLKVIKHLDGFSPIENPECFSEFLIQIHKAYRQTLNLKEKDGKIN